MKPRFAAPPPGACLCEKAEGMMLLYHRTSGQTHILVEPAPQILDALADAPLTEAELLAALEADFEVNSPDVIGERLSELIAAGLVSAT